jgi:3-hydroxyanthranilate 3,4-dioxygenase
MIVAGPNARKDFHYNETEELFYQLEGSIKVIVQEDGQRKKKSNCIPVTYLHQAKMPHSPFRRFDRAGNRAKRAGKSFTDGLLWYCDNCNHKLHEVYFELNNIEKTSCLI